MTKLLILLKVQIKQSFGISYFRYLLKNNRAKFLKQILLFLLIGMAFVSLFATIIKMFQGLYDLMHPLGQDALVFAVAFVASQTITLVFGIFYLVSHLYYAKDLKLLVTLPVKPSAILGSKFVMVIITEYGVTLPFVLPALYVYGTHAGPAWYFWLTALGITLLLPVIPLALASVFTILLMSLSSVAKNKDFFRVMGGLVGLAIFLGIQFMQVRLRGAGNPADLLTGSNGLVETITRKFPPSLWAARAVTGLPGSDGLYYLGIFLAATLAALILVWFLADRFFYRGLVSGQSGGPKRKKASAARKGLAGFGVRPPFISLLLKEWRFLFRSVAFLMPVLINIIILPVVIIISLVSNGDTSIGQILFLLQVNPWVQYILVFAVPGLVLWYGTSNSLAATSFSREGKTFWLTKVMPVPVRWHVLAKWLFAVVIPLCLLLLISVAEIVGLKFPLRLVLMQILLGLLGTFLATGFSLLLDMFDPKLDWTDPQQLFKRNTTTLISVFSSMAFLGLNAFAIFYLGYRHQLAPAQVYISIAALWALLFGLIVWILLAKSEKLFQRIDV